MELELGPFPKYESVRQNAYWTRSCIDTRLKIDEDSIERYKAHLQDCEKNPTIGLLARKKYITGNPMHYPEGARRNLNYLNRQPEVDSLQISLKNKIQKLYPKTKNIRQYIIDNRRVVLDSVKPAKKYGIFEKALLMCKKIK